MSQLPLVRRARRATIVAALMGAGLAGGIVAAPAQAGSYEQISRDTGADGWSRFTGQYRPVLASDSGRYAVYSYGENFYPGKSKGGYFIRDIVANTSRPIGDERIVQVFGIDKSEATILALRRLTGNASELVVVSTVTGAVRAIAQIPADETIWAALSGDGKTATYSSYLGTLGLQTVNVATGKATKIADGRYPLNARSLSDDGRVIATGEIPGGAYFVNGRKTVTAGPAVAAANGSVVISLTDPYLDGTDKITVRRVATGAEKNYSLPASISNGVLVWAAPDGGSVIISPSDTGKTQPAQKLDFATGTWTPLTGPYANAFDLVNLLEFDYGDNPISRNGKFAVLSYSAISVMPKQAALVNLSGGDLPGSQESLSASSYLGLSPLAPNCTEGGKILVNFGQPAPWLPAPRRAELSVYFNGSTTPVKKTWSAPNTDSPWAEIDVPVGTKWATIRGNVIDGAGKYLSTAETLAVPCFDSDWF